MSFFSRMFGEKRQPTSPLEEFGEYCKTAGMLAALRTNTRPEWRLAGGLACLVVHSGHVFASGLRKQLAEGPKLGGRPNPSIGYDQYMIEAAAFCHYCLTLKYKRWPHYREYEELSPVEQRDALPAYVCMEAVKYSDAMIETKLPAGSEKRWLRKRYAFYAEKAPGWERGMMDLFSAVVLSLLDEEPSCAGGVPGLGPNMTATIGATLETNIFCATYIGGLLESAARMFEKPDELLAELRPDP